MSPSWLVKSCVCTAALSAAKRPIEEVPVEIWEHLCKAPRVSSHPTPSLCSSSDAGSQHPLLCAEERHQALWAREAKEKFTFDAGVPKEKLFSWELVLGREACETVCSKMDLRLLFFAAALLQLDTDQAPVPLLML